MTKYKWKSSGNTRLSLPTPAYKTAHIRMLSGNISAKTTIVCWSGLLSLVCASTMAHGAKEPLQLFLCCGTIATHFQYGRTELIYLQWPRRLSAPAVRGLLPQLNSLSERSEQGITDWSSLITLARPVSNCCHPRLSQMKVIKNNQKYKTKCPVMCSGSQHS